MEPDTIKQAEMKEKNQQKVHQNNEKLLETNLCHRNLIERMNMLAVSLVKYTEPCLKYTKEDLQMDCPVGWGYRIHQ